MLRAYHCLGPCLAELAPALSAISSCTVRRSGPWHLQIIILTINELLLFNKHLNCLQDKDEAKTGKTYTVLVLEKNSIQITDLSPSTVYLFQVQALGPEGNVGSNSVEKEFSTLPEGKCRTGLK